MRPAQLAITAMLLICTISSHANPFFCPSTRKFVKPGMSIVQVASDCGEPTTKEENRQQATRRVPIQQIFYQFGGPAGNLPLNLIVVVKNGKIESMEFAGQGVNSASVCPGGIPVGVGDRAEKLIGTCGEPLTTNETYVDEPTGNLDNVEIWFYDFGQFQTKATFTFTNGVLTSIQPSK